MWTAHGKLTKKTGLINGLVRWILPPASCYNPRATDRTGVSGLPAQQSLDEPICNESQALFHNACHDIVSCSPPRAVGSAIVRKQPWGKVRKWCQHYGALTEIILSFSCRPTGFTSRFPCGGPLTTLAHQNLLAKLECKCLWKTGH